LKEKTELVKMKGAAPGRGGTPICIPISVGGAKRFKENSPSGGD